MYEGHVIAVSFDCVWMCVPASLNNLFWAAVKLHINALSMKVYIQRNTYKWNEYDSVKISDFIDI